MKRFILPVLLMCTSLTTSSVSLDYTSTLKSNGDQLIKISLDFKEAEAVFKKSLHLSTDHPNATIKDVTIHTKSVDRYLPEFKQNYKMYTEPVVIDVTLHQDQNSRQNLDQNMYINFQTYPALKTEEHTILITESATKITQAGCKNCQCHHPAKQPAHDSSSVEKKESFTEKWNQFLSFLQNTMEKTDSVWLKILLTFLLGLLFSLTPCIYPMIPITIGILHQSGKKSVLYNFLGSLNYGIGLSTTFAILGLLAAFAGASFGSALSSPLFVAFIVLFLGYMALTMIGVIDMYTPQFMRGGAQMNSKFGPLLSTFLFGIISGTVASPCVSPGLAFLLTYVAEVGIYALGFILLFAFGLGMTTPLILISTFSNSANFLPRSGMWMVEVKRILGFVMFTMCFYYLKNVVPFNILIWFITLYSLAVALYYIISAQSAEQQRAFKSFIGVVMLGLTVFLGFKIYESRIEKTETKATIPTPWVESYDAAMKQAEQENKALLLDFTAKHCGVCNLIDEKVFKNADFITGTQDMIVLHKVDCTYSTEEVQKIKTAYKVLGQPTILLVDPKTNAVSKKWTTEPYSLSIEQFIKQISDSL